MTESSPWIQRLVQEKPIIEPSLLAADFANLQREIEKLEAVGIKVLHVDVMDGHFVPNISVGVPVVESLRKVTNLPLDVHLMITEPEKYIKPFADAGADSLLFHIEAVPNPTELIQKIRNLGVAPGLVINPLTPIEVIAPYLDQPDILLTMSVQPGFGGQAFRPEVLEKVRYFKEKVRPDTLLSIDGGISEKTIAQAAEAGVDMFVAGTGLFKADDYGKQTALLRQEAAKGRDFSKN